MKLIKNNLSEKLIINKYLKKLNFKNKGTFDFENDGAYLDLKNGLLEPFFAPDTSACTLHSAFANSLI